MNEYGIFHAVRVTVEDIAEHIFSELSDEYRKYLSSLFKEDLIRLHHSFGRDIRNSYQLWHPDHPYTEAGVDIRDGIDYSPNHPDYYSMKVVERIWELCND